MSVVPILGLLHLSSVLAPPVRFSLVYFRLSFVFLVPLVLAKFARLFFLSQPLISLSGFELIVSTSTVLFCSVRNLDVTRATVVVVVVVALEISIL